MSSSKIELKHTEKPIVVIETLVQSSMIMPIRQRFVICSWELQLVTKIKINQLNLLTFFINLLPTILVFHWVRKIETFFSDFIGCCTFLMTRWWETSMKSKPPVRCEQQCWLRLSSYPAHPKYQLNNCMECRYV